MEGHATTKRANFTMTYEKNLYDSSRGGWGSGLPRLDFLQVYGGGEGGNALLYQSVSILLTLSL